jgi:ABC-type branched-subunit amino acid transport system substrate-binding protein
MALDLTTGPAAETYPSGHIQFDGKGDNAYPGVVVLQVQNGEPKVVYPVEVRKVNPIFPNPYYKP